MTCFYKHTVLTGLQAENKSPPMDNFPLIYAGNYGRILGDFWIAVWKLSEWDDSVGYGTLMPTFRCAIEKISDWHPYLFLEAHIVACVAVTRSYFPSPAMFEVTCESIVSDWLGEETQFMLELSWSEETERKAERLRATIQSRPIVEMAASALAFILTPNIVNLGQLDVTDYGDRADYRSLDMQSVLEISGTETGSELARRHREKVTQALANPFELDAYVVVCAFSPFAHLIRFSYHRWE